MSASPFGEEVEWVDVENLEDNFEIQEIGDEITSSQETKIPVVSSLEDWIQNPWTEDFM